MQRSDLQTTGTTAERTLPPDPNEDNEPLRLPITTSPSCSEVSIGCDKETGNKPGSFLGHFEVIRRFHQAREVDVMEGIEFARQAYPEFNVFAFKCLREFHLTANDDSPNNSPQGYTLELILDTIFNDRENFTLRIQFTEVQRLCIQSEGGAQILHSGLGIKDISDHQHERVHYEIRDIEYNNLSFVCDRVRIVSLAKKQ